MPQLVVPWHCPHYSQLTASTFQDQIWYLPLYLSYFFCCESWWIDYIAMGGLNQFTSLKTCKLSYKLSIIIKWLQINHILTYLFIVFSLSLSVWLCKCVGLKLCELCFFFNCFPNRSVWRRRKPLIAVSWIIQTDCENLLIWQSRWGFTFLCRWVPCDELERVVVIIVENSILVSFVANEVSVYHLANRKRLEKFYPFIAVCAV